MDTPKPAIAGTLESSDAQITVEPSSADLQVSIQSSVANQYGRQIKTTVTEVLARLGVTTGRVIVIDKGALDCTLKARIECAVLRSRSAASDKVPWGGDVR